MNYAIATLTDSLPQYFTIDRKLSGGMGATCFQGDVTKAIQFARKEDADKFAEAYYPFMSLSAQAVPV